MNNPINFTDPDGTWVDDAPKYIASTRIDATGKVINHINDKDNSIYQIINGREIKIGTEKAGVDYNLFVGQQLGAL